MTLFRLDASIFPDRSASRELADVVERQWLAEHPGADVVRRHVGAEPVPARTWPALVTAGATPAEQHSADQRDALELGRTLVEELTGAEAALLAVPLYNFGVSQHVKTWIDVVISAGGAGNRLLDGVPVVLATVRGGAYGAGTPREGWDHSTAYLRRILADVWGADLSVVEREFTLVGVNPALDEFTDLAAQLHTEALAEAETVGKDFARRTRLARAS